MKTRSVPPRSRVLCYGLLAIAWSGLAWSLEAATTQAAESGARVMVAVPNADSRPGKLTVAFSSGIAGLVNPGEIGDDGSGNVRGLVDCISEGGPVWRCEIPPGEWNLSFSAVGFSTALRLKATIPPEEMTDLGRITMARGSSLLGQLMLPEDLDPDLVDLSLTPQASDVDVFAGSPPQLSRRTPLQEGGIFHFRDLPAGTYRVIARATGWATAEEGPVEVFEDRETMLPRALEMQRVARFELCLHPAVPPGIRRSTDTWVPTLERTDRGGTMPAEGCISGNGCWQWVDLDPGRHELVVADRRHSLWLERAVQLPDGLTQLTIDLPLIAIEGTILRSGRPIRARLVFEEDRLEPTNARSIVLYSDVDGRFDGGLPDEGRWLVKAAFSASGPEQLLTAIDIVRPRGDQAIHIALDASP